ncbi:hypothetical protein HJC23_010028 [Cyclotella cryptica]|uniref:Uncharacterized protein n=1 Tax=Cyclotella cryptica TaxID=29204 RepID=A0ABD3PRR9_9STRA|eukprot:CCRYP_012081-RA/>CCRYP_012081-RA protein AED:0.06 eAED:0.06 QI:105/1/1/1/0.66/0.5/4/300/433
MKSSRRSWQVRYRCVACLLASAASAFQIGRGCRLLRLQKSRQFFSRLPLQTSRIPSRPDGLDRMSLAMNGAVEDLAPSKSSSMSPPSGSSDETLSTWSRSTMASQFQFQQLQLETLARILLPSLVSSLISTLLFPPLALSISYLIADPASFAVLSVDSSQFVQNFLTVTGLTFSILVGQTYYFMYQQQESVFNSLFGEVTEAKSLLEQVALVCQGRGDMYQVCLKAVQRYVEEDLKQGLGKEPAQVLSARPMDDPLEIILYLTSVGVPSSIYDTVRSLRQARALRLGALQKKLPPVHLLLLWLLAVIELSSFPVLGAGTQSIGGYNILTIESILFGILTFGVVVTLNVVGELYVGQGGAYNVDAVLAVMVKGLDEELEGRMADVAQSTLSDSWGVDDSERGRMELPSPFNVPRQRYFTSYLNGGEDSEEANSI